MGPEWTGEELSVSGARSRRKTGPHKVLQPSHRSPHLEGEREREVQSERDDGHVLRGDQAVPGQEVKKIYGPGAALHATCERTNQSAPRSSCDQPDLTVD